ncbi:hypothetical protein B0H10DRAFT_2228381 [Mycena sp. CBHHK59/15]|nr:hypothetical protein B0H10DRAFT_2228381 [Mycena sp. CBHHK59/15]
MPDPEGFGDEPDDGLVRTFQLPDQNATSTELREALKNAQLEMARLIVENRNLHAKMAEMLANQSVRKRKQAQHAGENLLGYQEVIVNLGKCFGVMEEPWIDLVIFTRVPQNGLPNDIEKIFADTTLYSQYLTEAVYAHVPNKFHELVDSAIFSDFGTNFIKQLGAGRSSAINALKSCFNQILVDLAIVTSPTPKNLRTLLFFPGDNSNLVKCSSLPPILYSGLKKNPQALFMNKALPIALRCMIFAAGSLQDEFTKKPQAHTLGRLWQLKCLTFGSIAFTCAAVIFVASGKDAIFEETGKTTGIPFQKYFRQYKKLLTVKADSAGTRRIIRFWTKIVFAGVTSVAIKDTEDVGDEDEEAAFEAAMEALDLGGSDDEENIESDAMNTETRPGETESDAAIDDDDDGEQVEVNNAVNHKDGPAEVNNEYAAQVVANAYTAQRQKIPDLDTCLLLSPFTHTRCLYAIPTRPASYRAIPSPISLALQLLSALPSGDHILTAPWISQECRLEPSACETMSKHCRNVVVHPAHNSCTRSERPSHCQHHILTPTLLQRSHLESPTHAVNAQLIFSIAPYDRHHSSQRPTCHDLHPDELMPQHALPHPIFPEFPPPSRPRYPPNHRGRSASPPS